MDRRFDNSSWNPQNRLRFEEEIISAAVWVDVTGSSTRFYVLDNSERKRYWAGEHSRPLHLFQQDLQ